MALEDFLDPEVAVTAAVTAAIFSPRARKLIRRGLVYGTAGVLIAGDAITSFARSVGQGIQEAGASDSTAAQNTMNQARTEASATGTSAGQKKTTQKNVTDKAKTEGRGG